MTKERTPAGGDRSEITYLDADGNRLATPEGATQVEIREFRKNIEISRTYGEIKAEDSPQDGTEKVTEED